MFFLKFSSTATLRVSYIRLCVLYCMQLDSALDNHLRASNGSIYHRMFDIIFISIDAFGLRQSYKSVLDSWGVKVIFVDEFHLAFTGMFSSWQVVAESSDLKSLNTKIVLLSAMTNLTAMRMMATYVEMNDNYFTVGGAYCYVVLNVAFRIKSSQHADLIYDIVNNIKSHLSQPHSENIAIHVITILSRGIAAKWLTSDCSDK